jgi:L-lactate dehydrogenase complex protein LldG
VADARSAIFGALAATRSASLPRPLRAARPTFDADPLPRFRAGLEAAGGEFIDARSEGLAATLARLPGFAAAEHVFSALPEVSHRGLASRASAGAELERLDFTLIRATVGVAESGAVWHEPGLPLERAAVLLAEHLVIALAADAIVELLHDAYARIALEHVRFGWFLCGPSKTADIEQALVLGAHGAIRASVLIV